MTGQTFAPSLAEIEALARAALSNLPEPFRKLSEGVLLRVEEFAEDEVLRDLGIDNAFELSGLYQGRSIAGEAMTGDLPDTVFLYRRAILDEWVDSGESLETLVTHIIVHEIGHHFGLDDDDIERIEGMA